jgi:hypothetical protein
MNRDRLLSGLLPGIVMPMLVGIGYYFYTFGFSSHENYLSVFMREEMLSPLLAIGCFFNLVIFFIFLRKSRERSAQGVVMATIFFGLCIVLMKLF